MFTITGITSIVITFIVSFKKGQWWQKGIYSCPLKAISDASLCILCTAFLQKLYCARVSHGMVRLVKWDIWVFWWNQPYYWKRRQLQYRTTLLGDVGTLMLLVCQPHRLLLRNRMYTWLNKPSVLVLNITNKQRKKTYNFLSSDRSEKIPGGSCSILFSPSDLQEWVSVSLWHKQFMRQNSLIKIHFKSGFNLTKRLIYKCSHYFRVWKQ